MNKEANMSSIKDLFEQAFGLDINKMKTEEPVLVEEANIGIKSYNESTGEICYSKILYAVKKKKKAMYELTFDNGNILKASKDHKIAFIKDKNIEWKNLADVFKDRKNLKDIKIVAQDNPVFLVDIKKIPAENPLDIEVEDTHCYFSNGVLSHNCMYGPDFKGTGGKAPGFYSAWMARVTRVGDITDPKTKELIGIECKVRNTKSKLDNPKREAILKVMFHSGINSDDEYFDYLVDLGIVTRAGAWYNHGFDEDGKPIEGDWQMHVQGKERMAEFLKERPDLYEKIKFQVNQMIQGHTVLDDNTVIDENGEVIENAWSQYESEDENNN